MPVTSTCKPWCRNHRDPDECTTRISIWDNGEKKENTVEPADGSLVAQFKALGDIPGIVTAIDLAVFQEDEDEQPMMDLNIYAIGYSEEEEVSRVHLGTDGLKELHSTLGAMLKKFA